MSWLTDTIQLVRDYANETSINAKWTDPKITRQLEFAFSIVLPEVFRNADGPNSVRWSLATTSGTSVYQRPPHVGEIIRIAKVTSTGRVQWTLEPKSRWNFRERGVFFDGPIIRIDPTWQQGDTLEVWYIPNGEVSLADGTALKTSGTHTTTSVQIDTAVNGTIDTRQNAYAGYILKIIDDSTGNQVNERVITASSHSAGTTTLTVEPALDFTPVDADNWEIYPHWAYKTQMAVALKTAQIIVGVEGMERREQALIRQYGHIMRELRLQAAQLDQIVGQHFRGDTAANERYWPGAY